MKNLLLGLTAILTLSIGSCTILAKPADMIPAGPGSAIEAVTGFVVARHDAYVEADQDLGADDRALCLLESAYAMDLTQAPRIRYDVAHSAYDTVVDRHDAYVRADTDLDSLEVESYLSSTERLRSIIEQAGKGVR